MSMNIPPSVNEKYINPDVPPPPQNSQPANSLAVGLVPPNLKNDSAYSMIGHVGEKNLYKGRYDPSNPLLASPLEHMRIALQTELKANVSIQDVYDKLYGALDSETQQNLDSLKQKSPYKDLDFMLLAASKSLVSMQSLEGVNEMQPNSLLQLFQHLKAYNSESQFAQNSIQETVQQMGAGYPYFDPVMRLSTETQDKLHQLQSLLKRDQFESPKNRDQLKELAESFEGLKNETLKTPLDDKWQILALNQSILSLLAATEASQINPLQFIGLHAATLGLDLKDSSLGLYGSSFEKISHHLSASLLSLASDVNLGQSKLFSNVVDILLGALLIGTNGFDLMRTENFGLNMEMFALLMIGSGVVDTTSLSIAELVTSKDDEKKAIGAGLSLTITLLVAELAAKDRQIVKSGIINELTPNLLTWLNTIDDHLDTHHSGSEMSILIKQAAYALEQKNEDIFVNVLDAFLEHIGVTTSQINTQSEDLKQQLVKPLLDGWMQRDQTIGHLSTGIFT